jgi:hypothetical protein
MVKVRHHHKRRSGVRRKRGATQKTGHFSVGVRTYYRAKPGRKNATLSREYATKRVGRRAAATAGDEGGRTRSGKRYRSGLRRMRAIRRILRSGRF